jgi:hypothetical protein
MPKLNITLSDAARETAEFYSTPAELERQARREIAAVLGRARFRTFNQQTMRIDLQFDHAGEPFTLIARSADAWLVETRDWERPCPPFPIIFSDRAVALINGLGWNVQGVEQRARLALKSAVPEDHGFCTFQVPLEEVPFICNLNDKDTVEIDLDDWWREHIGAG